MRGEDPQHLLSGFWQKLLSVAGVSDRLLLLSIRQSDVSQSRIRHVADIDPLDLDDTLPFILGPNSAASSVIDRSKHLSNAAEVTARVHAEEEIDRATAVVLLEGLVKALVTGFR